jgi:hypothetical protein
VPRAAVRRYGPTLLVLGLLTATAVAFVVAERVKLEKSPIRGPRVSEVFSPVCECPLRIATIAFSLSRRDRLDVAVVDAQSDVVRILVQARRFLAVHPLVFEWNGRDDEGRIVPEGIYRPRVRFLDRDRTIVLPNPIRVDVTPPTITALGVRPRVLSPDGDGRADAIAVRYEVDEPARALLLIDGVQRVRGKLREPPEGQLQWYGRAQGRTFSPRTYRLTLLGEDEAGNLSDPVSAGSIRIRYIVLGSRLLRTRARARFSVAVDTDARSYVWRFAGRRGVAGGPRLSLRAPRAGRYILVVEAGGHRARAVVVVRPRLRRR